jgi:hypothetical protein
MDTFSIQKPTWERYSVLQNVVTSLGVKEKRQIFSILRGQEHNTLDTVFFPNLGVTFSEFSVISIIGGGSKRKVCKK